MDRSVSLYVALTARVFFTWKQPVIDEVGGEELPYCLRVSLSQRFVEAAHHGLVFLSCLRHSYFLLLPTRILIQRVDTMSKMPPRGFRRIERWLIHQTAWKVHP